MRESKFQTQVIHELQELFPGCIILKNDSGYIQGIPDRLILFGPYWAALEIKASSSASMQPNQEYYIQRMDDMSFAAFIFPENKEEVLYGLQHAFGTVR